jgi:glucokinase
MNMLRHYLKEMVRMSPLQAYSLEIVSDEQTTRVLGAAVSASQIASMSTSGSGSVPAAR